MLNAKGKRLCSFLFLPGYSLSFIHFRICQRRFYRTKALKVSIADSLNRQSGGVDSLLPGQVDQLIEQLRLVLIEVFLQSLPAV